MILQQRGSNSLKRDHSYAMQVADINKVDPVFASILHGFFCKINMKKKMTKEVPEVELYTMDFPHAVYKGFIVLNKVKVFSFILFDREPRAVLGTALMMSRPSLSRRSFENQYRNSFDDVPT